MSETTTTDGEELTEKQRRERAFREMKLDGEHMVHRLRDWREGQIIWGWERENEGGSMGKTYTRAGVGQSMDDHPLDYEGHRQAMLAYHQHAKNASTGTVFLWVGRVTKVRTAPGDPHDPGEPPNKFAQFTDVRVVDSTDLDADEDMAADGDEWMEEHVTGDGYIDPEEDDA